MKLLLAAAAVSIVATQQQPALPEGFSYLADVDASIGQDMRYAGSGNFTGGPVEGYGAAECVLATETARALSRVQSRLAQEGLGLLVYDCYRPARAVASFMRWARRDGDARDPQYHPNVRRKQLVAQGYIAARSGHSSGGSVDLTLVRRDAGGAGEPLDMGGGFDLFDPLSHAGAKGLAQSARDNRRKLAAVMKAEGFGGYSREWWHFRHGREPFAGRSFDFEIVARNPL